MKKTIFITGASTGIGKATALFFANKNWNVAATMRTPKEDNELNNHKNIKLYKLDVTNDNQINEAVHQSIRDFGKVDVVLNNAGYGTAGPFEAASNEQIKRQFDTNLFGLMKVTKAFLPHFRSNQSGTFINISSIGGLVTFPIFSLYHSTKWAVEGFSESLSYELAPLGIKVKLVEPGGVKTDFASRSLDILQDPDIKDYDPTVTAINKLFSPENNRIENYSEPGAIAKTIFEAANDSSNKLRFIAGNDAKQIWDARQNLKYEDFNQMIKTQFLSQN